MAKIIKKLKSKTRKVRGKHPRGASEKTKESKVRKLIRWLKTRKVKKVVKGKKMKKSVKGKKKR